MTPEEKFQFDLEGYLVVRGVLGSDELAELNAIAGDPPGGWGDGPFYRASKISQWGPGYQALIDHPKLVPYLLELVGPRVRLDHDYCIFMRQGAPNGNLHGGSSPQIGSGDQFKALASFGGGGDRIGDLEMSFVIYGAAHAAEADDGDFVGGHFFLQ